MAGLDLDGLDDGAGKLMCVSFRVESRGEESKGERGAYNPVTGLQAPRASSVPLMSKVEPWKLASEKRVA